MDNHTYSPSLLQKITEAGGQLPSFAAAAFALNLFGVDISPRHVNRLTQEIGNELIADRDKKVIKQRRRELHCRVEQTSKAVVVELDGGRVKTRQEGCGPGVHQPQFKEEKVAAFVTLQSEVHPSDPSPEPPPSFEEPRRIVRLVKQMKGFSRSGESEKAPDEEAAESSPNQGQEAVLPWAPKKKIRTCVASMVESKRFGPMMASEAQERGFYNAQRRAFVADGATYNWSIQQGYFKDFEPITDFLHVICYLYKAACGVSEDREWEVYLSWMRSCWQGDVGEVLSELRVWQERLGEIEEGEELAWNDPRKLVREAVSYLGNNQSRMSYPRYRREGLPTTSSLAESLVGEFNARVKENKKFWNRPDGAEPVLQVRAAILSEDGRLERHFENRPGCPYRKHSRRKTA